jgi:carbonic anhydrase
MPDKIVCADAFPNSKTFNVPRNIVSFEGDEFSATKCLYKCLYWFNYKNSTCNIENESDRLSINYDGVGSEITFNGATYNTKTVYIYRPSLHEYDGVQAEGEIIIEHTNKNATMSGLLVCIPLTSTTGNISPAGSLIEQIIQQAPTDKFEPESSNITDFNLNSIIPVAPYYTYTGPRPYDQCDSTKKYQYVVFHTAKTGGIGISSIKMDKLDKLISFSYIKASKGKDIFYNPTGTSNNGFNGEDQIYISCQPTDTGDNEEKIYQEPKSPLKNVGAGAEIISFIIIMIIGAAFVMLAFWIFKQVMGFLSHAPKEVKIITGGVRSK